jgi:hypothetical protein
MMEFAFYRCEKSKKEWGDYTKYENHAIVSSEDYSYTENYGLPRQQVRIGVRYSF